MVIIISWSYLVTRFPKGSLFLRCGLLATLNFGKTCTRFHTLPRKIQIFFAGALKVEFLAERGVDQNEWYPWCAHRPFLKVNQSTLLVEWGRKSALIRWGKMGLRHQWAFENRSESRLRVETTRTLHSNCRLRAGNWWSQFLLFLTSSIHQHEWLAFNNSFLLSLIWRPEQRIWINRYVLFIVKCVFYYFLS